MHALGGPVLVPPYTSVGLAWLGYSREYNVIMQIFFCQPRIKFPDLSDEKRKAPGKLQTLPLFLLLTAICFTHIESPKWADMNIYAAGSDREREREQTKLSIKLILPKASVNYISLWV